MTEPKRTPERAIFNLNEFVKRIAEQRPPYSEIERHVKDFWKAQIEPLLSPPTPATEGPDISAKYDERCPLCKEKGQPWSFCSVYHKHLRQPEAETSPICPYIITGKEGTSYCKLAESGPSPDEAVRKAEQAVIEAARGLVEALEHPHISIPHLVDTDDNPGQFLRDSLAVLDTLKAKGGENAGD